MKNLFKTSLLLLCITFLSACAESVNVKGIQELADKVEQASEIVGSQELEQISDAVGNAAEFAGEIENLTEVLTQLPDEVNEDKIVTAQIESCYDGDTCKAFVNGQKESLRFLLVDSSEIKGGPMPYAEEARDFLNELVKGKEIVLDLGKGDSRDKYDRLLVYGFLPSGENIQEMMLEEGLLTVRYIYDDQKYLDDYRAAMEQAKASKTGIWSIPGYAGYDRPYNMDAVK
ncbi:thermonuclease family protein [Fredinandcohnia sp. QZ13]|uniref:thermonuclease family protein n=1 Tax=Fredinandcohnia sp. QZ13 TaxID=3073144 RepID=UPI0028532527|nr:thermonuclease family protein [Fredinandcohnia sp. QZ13]MDR4888558.1 thermonuclease family protein [Fredinandcohnia sp. QZ13]